MCHHRVDARIDFVFGLVARAPVSAAVTVCPGGSGPGSGMDFSSLEVCPLWPSLEVCPLWQPTMERSALSHHDPGRRSTGVMLGHACEMLAVMYLQRGPPIAENETTTHRTHRTHRT
jgi:hypothetical protein